MLWASPHFEAILLQVSCTFCWLAQWQDLILVVEGDISLVYFYLDHRIYWRGDVLYSQNFLHLFSLRDSKKSQNNFIKLVMVRWLPPLLILLKSYYPQGWQELWFTIPINTLHSFKSVATVYFFKLLMSQLIHICLTFT